MAYAPSTRESNGFAAEILDTSYLLQSAIDWIQGKLDPEDVFTEEQLARWANDNGYVKDGE